MKLDKIQVAYPFLEYTVQVTHHTERKSTAMEWMLLEIAKITEKFPEEYSSVPLETILSSIFLLTNTKIRLRPVLIRLVNVNALEPIPELSDNSEWSNLKCEDLRLTSDGRRLQSEGKLPAKAQVNKIKVVYDVVNNRLVNTTNGMLDDTSFTKAKNISKENLPGFPNSLVFKRIKEWQEGKGQHSWLQHNSRIDSIIPEEDVNLKWKIISHEMIIENSGELRLSNVLDHKISESVLLETNLGNVPDYDLPIIDVNSLEKKQKTAPYGTITDNIKDSVDKANIYAIAPQFSDFINNHKSVCLLLGQQSLQFVSLGNCTVIHIPESYPKGFCYQDSYKCIFAAITNGYVGNQSKPIPYLYEEQLDFSSFVISLVKKYYMKDRRIMSILRLVENVSYKDLYTPNYIRDLLNSKETLLFTPVDNYLSNLKNINQKITEIFGEETFPLTSAAVYSKLGNIEEGLRKKIRELTINWNKSVEEIKKLTQIDLNDIDWNDSYFGLSLNRIKVVSENLLTLIPETSGTSKNIYILDTSALMKKPNVLDLFSNNFSQVIVPKSVLIELDGLKKKNNARVAIEQIQKYGDWINTNEDSYPELLSKSYREARKTDLLILSVAIKYRSSHPIIVTNDINFQTFAKSEGIDAISVENLHKKQKIFSSKIKKPHHKKHKEEK